MAHTAPGDDPAPAQGPGGPDPAPLLLARPGAVVARCEFDLLPHSEVPPCRTSNLRAQKGTANIVP